MRRFIALVVLIAVFGTGSFSKELWASSDGTRQYESLDIGGPGWFYIEIFDCMFPVPNHYVLVPKLGHRSILYIYSLGDGLLAEEGNLIIGDIADDPWPVDDKFEFEELGKHGNLFYGSLSYTKGILGYVFRDDSHYVFMSKREIELIDAIFEYCKAHPTEDELECETIEGVYFCTSN